ncbi:transporter, partial [Streptococcus suis]
VNNIFHISELTSQYSFFIWLLFVFFAINGFLLQFAKGIDKIFEMGLAGVIGTFSMVVFNILFLTILDLGLPGFFIANIIGYLLPSLYLFWKLELWNYFTWTS